MLALALRFVERDFINQEILGPNFDLAAHSRRIGEILLRKRRSICDGGLRIWDWRRQFLFSIRFPLVNSTILKAPNQRFTSTLARPHLRPRHSPQTAICANRFQS